MKRRIEPEAPLLGQIAREPDVDDQELVVEDLAGEGQAEQVAHRAAYPVARHQPVAVEKIAAIRRLDLGRHSIGATCHANYLVAMAQLDQPLLRATLIE